MHPFQALFAGKSGCGNIHAMVERLILMYPGSEEPVGLRYLGCPSLVPGAYQRLVVGSPQMLFLFPAFPQRVWKRLMSWLRSAMPEDLQTMLVICCKGSKEQRAIQTWKDRQVYLEERNRSRSCCSNASSRQRVGPQRSILTASECPRSPQHSKAL